MAALTAVNLYISANILLGVAALFLIGFRAVSARLSSSVAFRHQLHFGQALAAAAVLLPWVALFSHPAGHLPQVAQIWSAQTMQSSPSTINDHRLAICLSHDGVSMSLEAATGVTAVLFLAGLVFLLGRVVLDGLATLRIISAAQLIRRRGRLRILSSEQIGAPFSFWWPGRHYIVVPAPLVLRLEDLRLAIRHEAQHHRQLDTRMLYLYQVFRACFFWNPAVHRLEKSLRELQEFACDEAVSRQRNVSAQEYCSSLLRIAQSATQNRHVTVRASMIGGSGALLKRRIQAMLTCPDVHLSNPSVMVTGGFALVLMAATAVIFASTIRDWRVSADQAARMASIAQRDSTFPVVVNDRVLQQLNLLLATPDGREYLHGGLDRLQRHRAYLSDQIARHGMPLELLAVPLVESGYLNLPRTADPQRGAGLWMFIAPTARRFGLSVGATRDERLDVPAETAAAIQLFTNLRLQFNDWGLAILGYNTGDAAVETAIRETGSRDVWEIIGKGYENDQDYVPRVMAAILIIKNPTVLN
jgi:membrane-bound lytic murein transglycosylase D